MPSIRSLPGSCLLVALIAGTAAAGHHESSTAAQDAIAASTSAILQGDAGKALAALEPVPEAEFSAMDAGYRACMFARLQRTSPPQLVDRIDDAFSEEVLRLYRDYWWHALQAPAQRMALEQRLHGQLQALLGSAAESAADFDALEPLLTADLERRGFHAQLGRTPPLRELMLWRRQDSRSYDVRLPEGPHTVQVDLLDDFVTRGWSAYGRCERGSSGGWATAEKLYAIVPAYDKDGGLASEAFRVVFLGHETQHFADQNRYPGMTSWELEYRAKLVELAQAETVSGKRLRGFMTAQSDNIDSPHTYANKRLVAALTARLGRAPDTVLVPELQAAARAELLADSARREPGGK
jgi:hypothetical protein